ncbi:MAG: peptidase domain-containing ABC transporter [Bacteroidetes bacterium]|nr:MAG: peptidase domain-containing ABC transporter [Bacteroidota bacterium]
MVSFPFFKQLDSMDCGPTCLRMIAHHYGRRFSVQKLRELSYISHQGVSLLGISEAAEKIGFRTLGARLNFEKLTEVPLPCIVHWHHNHFVVVYKIVQKKNTTCVYAADPAHGLLKYTKKEFLNCWLSTISEGEEKGFGLLIEPTPDFYLADDEKSARSNFFYIFSYLKPHKRFFFQLAIGLLLGSLLQLMLPFLTQSMVDFGISNQNIAFVYLVLVAQLMLLISRTSVDFIRSWILLHISTRINIALISDFLIKLMKLPMVFFDSKNLGDIMQRIGDHTRIEQFLTNSSLSILFSFINLLIFSIVLLIYSVNIFALFLTGSILYTLWITLFMKRRRDLDYKRFDQLAANQSNLFQLVTSMQEIKQNNSERQKRWEWERIQVRLFRVSIKSLTLSQYQQFGSIFINEIKNIMISFLAAKSVIDGSMTLGMMLAVQYIIGQLNGPIEQMIGFVQMAQDAKISFERLAEIHKKDDEDQVCEGKLTKLPDNRSIILQNIVFQYQGPKSEKVLEDINFTIPQNKITAIVGASGSGKTTLMKLILGYYPPVKGEIRLGETGLDNIHIKEWRNACGVVMQDGFIFSDTIANNITISDEHPDKKRLLHAVKVANIQDFIVGSLPMAYNTKIGSEGHGLSQGQKQRILIARAVYKNPEFIFFDEATNALDANNEMIIMKNLSQFFEGKTVVIVAHRLSTVKNADQIVVLEKGRIIEIGNHNELTAGKGAYYNLVKNQLELGA